MREQSDGIRELQSGGLREGMEGEAPGPPSSHFSLSQLSRKSQNGFEDESKLLLLPLEMLLHAPGGEVAEFRRPRKCPLPCPILTPFHPPLSLPHGPGRGAQGVQGTHGFLGGHSGAKAGPTCVS